MEIRVEWRRVLNLRPYETETIMLGVTESVRFPEERVTLAPGAVVEGGVQSGPELARLVEKAKVAERLLFQHLTEVGDQLVVERLQAAQLAPPRGVGPEGIRSTGTGRR